MNAHTDSTLTSNGLDISGADHATYGDDTSAGADPTFANVRPVQANTHLQHGINTQQPSAPTTDPPNRQPLAPETDLLIQQPAPNDTRQSNQAGGNPVTTNSRVDGDDQQTSDIEEARTQQSISTRDGSTQSDARSSDESIPAAANRQQHNGNNGRASTLPQQWYSIYLRHWYLLTLLAVSILLVAAISTTTALSALNHGFVKVSDHSQTIVGYKFGWALLWTSLPTFVLVLYGFAFAAVIDAAAFRQPYVELYIGQPTGAGNLSQGASLKRSVLLDYAAYHSIIRPFAALRKGHLMLAISFFFTPLSVRLLLPSLAAHLFSSEIVASATSVDVVRDTVYNGAGYSARDSLTSIFGLVSGTRVFGGQLPPWITDDFNFQNFSAPTIPAGLNGLANFSIDSTAYYAELDCRILGPNKSEIVLEETGNKSPGLYGNDRGCSFFYPLVVPGLSSGYRTYYLQTFKVTCPVGTGPGRLVLFAAANSNSAENHIANISTISCGTNYYQAHGRLKVIYGLPGIDGPKIDTFSINTTELVSPQSAPLFEEVLNQSEVFDPTDTLSATDFGRLILQLTQSRFPQKFLQSDILLTSMEELFRTVYAVVARQYLTQRGQESKQSGLLMVTNTKLVTVYPIAYITLAILLFVIVLLLSIYWDARHTVSILYEEPRGLIGADRLLQDSDLREQVHRVLTAAPENATRLRKAFEHNVASTGGWIYKDWDKPSEARIIKTDSPRLADPTAETSRLSRWKDRYERRFGH